MRQLPARGKSVFSVNNSTRELSEARVDKTPGAVRQIAHRAREHVAARRPRIQVDRAEHQQVVDRFLAAGRPEIEHSISSDPRRNVVAQTVEAQRLTK